MDLIRYHMISEIFLTMTITRSEDINKDDTSILNLLKKTFSFRKPFGIVLTEEIRKAKFCTEVFVMPKHLMIEEYIYQNHPYTCLHSVQSFYPNNIAELL